MTRRLPVWSTGTLLLLSLTLNAGQLDQAGSGQTAPSQLKQMTLEELSQIEVTSPSKQPTPAFRSPVAIYVITGEDIRRSGVTTIPAALRLAPGVEVARIDSSKWSVGIRGFGTDLSRSVLVLIDGRSVYTPLFAGTYWDVQDTLLEDIDRIEVIRGPGGTIWGPNAINGVINIITKSSAETQGIYASVVGGSTEQGFTNFRYGGSNGKGLTYRLYTKEFTRGPGYHFNPDNFDDWRGVRAGFRLDWGQPDTDSFTVQGDIYSQEAGEVVALGSYLPPSEKLLEGNGGMSGGNVLARWTRKLTDGNDFQVQAYYDRTNRSDLNLGESRDTFDLDFIAHSTVKSRHSLSYGLGARFSYGRVQEVASGLVFNPTNRLDYLATAFFQDDISLVSNKLVLSAGTKLLRTNFAGLDFQPSVRLLWTPTDRQSFWAAFTHAVRTPSRVEHDFYLSSYLGPSNGYPFFGRFNANPDFAPEQLNGYEVGYRTMIRSNLFIDFAGFRNHYHDLLSQDLAGPISLSSTLPFPEPVAPPTYVLISAKFENDFYGTTTGGEIAPEWRPSDSWRLRASYSFLDMNLQKSPGTAPANDPRSTVGASPRHEAKVQSYYDLTKKLQLDLTFRYVSALPALATPSYSTGDVRLGWRFYRQFELSIVGANLLQPHHVEYSTENIGLRRSVYASLAWRQ